MSPNFDLWFVSPVTELLRENGRVVGVHASRQGEAINVRAKVTVGADGRTSMVRKKGEFEPEYEDHDFDLLWFTIPKPDGWDNTVRAFISKNHNYLTLPKYPHHIQVGILMKTGEFPEYRKKGIEALRKELLEAHPILKDFAMSLKDFSPFVVLAAVAERMKEWAKDGVILIGDSAHTCSPAGAIGVSVAVGTSIVAADGSLMLMQQSESIKHSSIFIIHYQKTV
jgi:2-polyprenyl-6-methoxyphenol hydroxylase-like FAD-dependent oxidoreductase